MRCAKSTGVFRTSAGGRWRQRRLLILCYHGISLDDEHKWNPRLYMPPGLFEQRLALLHKNGCNVLPLDEAILRMYDGTLPPMSVTITFDDGFHDFYAKAYPLLRRYGYLATVYLTTSYCGRNSPVFNPACYYLLWKARGRVLDGCNFGISSMLDLTTPDGIDRARLALTSFVTSHSLDGNAKSRLLLDLCGSIGIDYTELTRNRLLQLMSPAEIRELASAGVNFQLHTHRHRAPASRDLFFREIQENRKHILDLTGRNPVHLCYPSNEYRLDFLPWLVQLSVSTATTCDAGLASQRSNTLLLPRLVDHCGLSNIEFESWLYGCAEFLPKRKVAARVSYTRSGTT